MSKLVGSMLFTAAIAAGHEFTKFETYGDFADNAIHVRLSNHEKAVHFTVPAHLFDPVEYAKVKWPEWFAKRGQMDLFKQE